MPAVTGRGRYWRILRFALAQIITSWWFDILLPKVGLREVAKRGQLARWQRTAHRFRELAIALGGLMIKVGQFLSARLDVLPPEMTRELEGLQDEVPAVPFDEIRTLAEAQLGVRLTEAFASFEPVPIAAASLGQAHSARLVDAEAAEAGFAEVVVKVQRPGIAEIVAIDLAALRRIAGWLSHVRFIARRVDLPALVEEFAHVSLEEIDYLHEAENAETFATNAAGNHLVHAPRIVWERTTGQVLTMEDVTALKANDAEAIRAAGIDPTELAHVFARTMFDQLFRDGFFHADPHPGNLFVTPARVPAAASATAGSTAGSATTSVTESSTVGSAAASAGSWQLTFVDFGMMGRVPDELRTGLRELIIAVAARDAKRLVASVGLIGVLLPTADTAELEHALTGLFARFGGMGFAQLREVDEKELRAFSADFERVVRDLPVQLPENLFLVIRALSLVSGLCSSLDPTFNIWEVVEPYATELLADEKGGVAGTVVKEALSLVRLTIGLPQRLDSLVQRLEDGELSVATPKLDRRVAGLEHLARGVISAVLFTGFVIAGTILLGTTTAGGVILLIVSAFPLAHALFTLARHERYGRR